MARRKGGMSKRAVVKRSTMGGHVSAIRDGKRFVAERKQHQYIPRNGVKTCSRKSDEQLMLEAWARVDAHQQHLNAGGHPAE